MVLLTGSAGWGKSVLSRCVAEHFQFRSLNRDSGSGYLLVSHFYSYVEAALKGEEVVLRTLLHQLVQLNPSSRALVRSRLETRIMDEKFLALTVEKMWKALRELLFIQTVSRVVIVIDAVEKLGKTVVAAVLGGLWTIVSALNRMQQDSCLRVFISAVPTLCRPLGRSRAWRCCISATFI